MEDYFMRCNVTLQNQSGGVLFPFNYNHILTSVIYNNLLVAGIDLDFHDSKDFKFFTFSNIIFSITINGNDFTMTNIVMLKEPKFTNKMEFRTMSPIVVNSYKQINGELRNWDLSPDDKNFFPFIERNLINKYNQFFNEELSEDSIKVSSNMENVKKKRIMVKRNRLQQHYVCYMMDITLEGDPKVIKFAYDCGLSNKNSIGFGMIKVIKNKK